MELILGLMAGLGLLLGAAGLVAVLALRKRVLRQAEEQAAALQQMKDEVRALASTAFGVGRKLASLEQGLQQISSERGSEADGPKTDKPYQMAAKLMQRGADIEELMSVCELTRGEAELLASLYRKKSA